MNYNTAMRGKSDIIKLLRIASFLWFAYLGISATIDHVLKNPGPVERFIYIADAGIAAFFLVISYIPSIQEKLGKAFLPATIVLISALPIAVNQIAVRYLFPGPLPPPEAMLTRVIPFLLIALLLVAWQFRWQYILAFCLVLALVNLGILWAFVANDPGAFGGGLFAIVTQIVSFLVIGFFISVIVGWLRSQQSSLEEANAKLANYTRTLEDLATTRERNRIAQELHDTLSHTLSGLSVQLETMKAYWDADPLTARKRLDKSLIAIRSGLEETRRVLTALRAKPLEELGLVPAIRQMAEETAGHAGMNLDMLIDDAIPPLSPAEEQCVFRVAQEAITNSIRHSRANNLRLKLQFIENKVTLTVQDDGIGFDVNNGNRERRYGLTGMKERAAFAKGNLAIDSHPGGGTTIQLVMPE